MKRFNRILFIAFALYMLGMILTSCDMLHGVPVIPPSMDFATVHHHRLDSQGGNHTRPPLARLI